METSPKINLKTRKDGKSDIKEDLAFRVLFLEGSRRSRPLSVSEHGNYYQKRLVSFWDSFCDEKYYHAELVKRRKGPRGNGVKNPTGALPPF